MAKPGQNQLNLPLLYADLKRCGDAQNYEKAIKTAESILKAAPGESDAARYKVVCLIQLSNFQNALDILNKYSEVLSGMVFEKAYCEYRLYRNEESLATLRGAGKLDLRGKELLAQLLYRLEDYEAAMNLYKEVVKNSNDDYDDERQINVSAVAAALSLSNATSDLVTPDAADDNSDKYYNAACFLIGQKDYEGAQSQLTRAIDLCQESLEDEDMTEEEKEDELAIIRVQLAYCMQMLGKTDEALKIYNSLFKNKPSDMTVTAVAANNTVTINQDQNVFDSKKKMKLATAPELSKKLTSSQLKSIDVNNCLLAYHSNQVDVCRSLCQTLRKKYADVTDLAVLIESSLLVKSRQQLAALELLKSHVTQSEELSLPVQLSLANLHLSLGDASQVCQVLRKLGHVTYKPAIVSLLVSLYMSQGADDSVSEFFNDVISWYEKNERNGTSFPHILRSAAEFQLRLKNPRVAASFLEKLRKLTPDNRNVLSMLFAAYSQFDPPKAKKISNELPSIESLAEAIDVDALEESSASLANKYKAKKEEKAATTFDKSDVLIVSKKKAKRKRKGKLPKDYNPDVDPNPERWLPRRERSNYKGHRRDKRKEAVGKGSQGATVAGGPELDITKMDSSTSESVSQPVGTSSKGYSASKQQQKKKKTKKGKK